MVVRSGEDAKAVGGSEGDAVDGSLVSEGGGILGQGSFLYIEAGFTTNQETFVCNDTVDGGIDVACSWDKLAESAGVEGSLLEVEVSLLRLEAGLWCDLTYILGLDSSSEDVVELDLGGDDIVAGPCASCGNT